MRGFGVLTLMIGLTLGAWPALAAPADAADDAATDATPTVVAEEVGPSGPEPSPETIIQERVTVVGSADGVKRVTGSAHYIGQEELDEHENSDIHRILARVPGVYLQDEEGYGLRPNIGMRGTGVERSQKVTLLEDGVLIAPAPYAAPSAYYFPTAGRMSAVEVSKGPSSIEQGPYTNGGVLNLISAPIPLKFGGDAELAVGEDGQGRGHLRVGDSGRRLGWMLEGYRLRADGFKRLDGGGETGFDLADYLGKLQLRSRPAAPTYQSLELKLGLVDQDGRETYLGLTAEDFVQEPYRRYAASSEDGIRTEHEQVQLRHFVVPTDRLDLTTTVYRNDFFRNWRKLERVDGESIASVLADPGAFADRVAILRGELDSAPGVLDVRNNRRDYYSQGVQSVLGLRLGTADRGQTLELGLRLHRDEEDRFQEEDGFQMLDGAMVQTTSGPPGSQANRITRARAIALFARDTLTRGRWTLTPGVRLENIHFTRLDFGVEDSARTGADLSLRKNDVTEIIPGIGADYRVSPALSLFAGLHRGFSPPGPGQDRQTRPEESLNHEIGVRFEQGTFDLQAVAFYNRYDNLLGTDTVSGGGPGSGDVFNGGEARVGGLELSMSYDALRGRGGVRSIPFRIAYTYTEAEFRSSFETDFPDWAPEVRVGDALPYLPEDQLFAQVGWRDAAWSLFLSGSYVGTMRTTAGQGPIPESERIDDRLVFDLSAEARFGGRYRAFLQVRNLTDEVYVAARRPAGLRPGLPRSALAGFGLRF